MLGVVALRAADALIERSRAIIAANLPLVDALMAEHADQLDWVRPVGRLDRFPRYRGAEGIDAFNERLVSEQGVLLLPGRVYGYGDGHFRLGLRPPQPARGGRAARPAAARVSEYDRIGGTYASDAPARPAHRAADRGRRSATRAASSTSARARARTSRATARSSPSSPRP